MIEKFKSLNKKNKIILGIIAVILFPITLILLASELTLNGFRDNRLGKIIGGIVCLLIIIAMISPTEGAISTEEYENVKTQLDDANTQLTDEKAKVSELEYKVKEAEIYLSLDQKDRDMINTEIESKQNETKIAEENKQKEEEAAKKAEESKKTEESNKENESNSGEVADTQQNDTVVKSYSSDNSATQPSQQEDYSQNTSNQGDTVYANGGRSKSNKYHSSPTAHNMEGAISMSRSEAEASGYVPCGKCY